MDDETLQLLIDEGIVIDEAPIEAAVVDAIPSLPPTTIKPIRTYVPKKRISSSGREYVYGNFIKEYLENESFLDKKVLAQG